MNEDQVSTKLQQIEDEALRVRATDHPAHYGGAENVYEAIKVIEAWGLDFCTGNAVKYISRAGKKAGQTEAQDILKAVWYLKRRYKQLTGFDAP